MSQPAPLLELRGVTHRFGTTVALEEASLQVRAGTIHALLGENGAGKTTLMRIAFGLVAADRGTVLVNGRTASIRSAAAAIGHGLGMVHQHFTLIPAMSAAANVALGGHGRLDLSAVRRSLTELSAASGLPIDPDALVESLSVAQQQRVEILKALSRDARVLILDEPTAVLAPAEADELLRWLRGYADRGNAVVLITHKLREAVAAADDVTVLRRGRVVLHARGDDAAAPPTTQDQLAAAMLGEADRPPSHRDAADAPVPGAIVAGLHSVAARRGRERISGATIAVRAGEVVGVAGIEGSGHQLLTLLLAGRLAPEAGTVELPPAIGYIPEDRHRDAVAADRSLAENVALRGAGRRRGLMRWAEWRERTDALVARYDVRGPRERTSMAAQPMHALSGGNQQKLVVARELGDGPRLVVAEHPTRGLDVRAAAGVRQRLREAARAGAAVVVYTPDLDEVLAIADRVIVVHAGAVRDCTRDRDAVGRAMLGLQ